jgi:hypothetical protein
MTFRHRVVARPVRSGPSSARNIIALFAFGAAIAGAGFAAKGIGAQQPAARALQARAETTPLDAAPQAAPRPAYTGLFDPAYSLGLAAPSFDNAAMLRAAAWEAPAIAPAAPETVATLTKPTPVAEAIDAAPAPPERLAEAASEETVPEPPRRPGDLAPAFTPRPEQPRQRFASRARVRNAPMTQARAEPSFFERLFGSARAPEGPAMAYAAPGALPNDAGAIAPRAAPSDTAAPRAGGGRAIYDITAQLVHMPDGTRLEAHSGLGAMRDNPNYAHLRMRGVTPPHVYNLRMREALFHGVRAIRLHPVGGSGAIFGRAGLLAHTYMLGPGGDSNGCVSFRDYNAFLQAFLRGEVSQLVVVNSIRDATPRFAAR